MEYSEESFENVEAKKPSVPDLGAQILVEISRWLLDKGFFCSCFKGDDLLRAMVKEIKLI